MTLQSNEKKPEKINELILKTKADLKEGSDTYNSHPWIMLSFNSLKEYYYLKDCYY